jgi:hypothetical protein
MANAPDDSSRRRVERMDSETMEARLRQAASCLQPDRVMDNMEVQHLLRVITECSILLKDVYSESRITRIMHPEKGSLNSLIDRMIAQERPGQDAVLFRVRHLPDDVRLIGDKALFDLGLQGLREVKGYDLEELGARAYQTTATVLELLAEDQRLREFFKANRLLMLPLEEEVVFLRQCSEKFRLYADILKRTHDPSPERVERAVLSELAQRVPLMAAAAQALDHRQPGPIVLTPAAEKLADDYLEAARGESGAETAASREQRLSLYERILLFSSLDMSRLGEALNATVIDQQRAVQALCDEFALFAAGTRDQRKPPAYFMVGPTGVGKNHLVESLCRLLEGIWKIAIPQLTIEGPNYTYPSDINELRGATRGFIRSDEEGLLTAFHGKSSQAPFSVIVVDEVEKAHPQLLTFFLPILDRGTTTDNRGDALNFSNCMLFFTSNLGYSDIQRRTARIGYGDEGSRFDAADCDVRRDLRRALQPEFVNRVKMIHFDRLSMSSAERILDLEMDRIARRYEELHGLRIALEPSARVELIRRGFSPAYGARHLAAVIEAICNVEIAKKVRGDDRDGDRDHDALIGWLRDMRAGKRAYDAAEVELRARRLTRARLGYDQLRVTFEEGCFRYEPVNSPEA